MATDSILRPGELKEILLKEIQAADLAEIDVREVGTALEVKDGIARIYGLTSAMAGEMLEFTSSETGEKVTGQALNLEEDNIGAVIFGDYLVLREGDEVRRSGRDLQSEGRRVVVRVRGDRAEGLGRRGRVRKAQGIRRDGVHHRGARVRLGARPDAIHRALLGLCDGGVFHV